MTIDQPAPDTERLFRFFCPKCSGDSDAEDRIFGLSIVTYVPRTAFMIAEMHCETCGETFALCYWPVDHHSLARSMAAKGLSLEPEDEETVALLNRYHRLVEMQQATWGDLFAGEQPEEHPQRIMDLSQEYVAPDTRRLTAVHARVLAVARGDCGRRSPWLRDCLASQSWLLAPSSAS